MGRYLMMGRASREPPCLPVPTEIMVSVHRVPVNHIHVAFRCKRSPDRLPSMEVGIAFFRQGNFKLDGRFIS